MRWRCPVEDWFKLNSNGACKGDANRAGCAGLLRDDGRWIKGFVRRLGTCTALHAELWGMWIGVEMAYQSDIAKLIIGSDSKTLVDMLTSDNDDPKLSTTIVKRIQELLASDWEVEITHVYLERREQLC